MSNDFNASETPVIRQRGGAQDPDQAPVADLSAAHARELRRAQLEQVLSGSVIAVIVHLLGAAVLALVLWPHVSHVQVLAWLGLTLAVLSYRVACQILCRARPKTDPRSQRLYLLVACYLSGLIWGSSSMIFLPVLDFPQQADHARQVRQVAVDNADPVGDAQPAQAAVLKSAGAGPPGHAVDLIALFQQELRQIGAVLTCDTGDHCAGQGLPL